MHLVGRGEVKQAQNCEPGELVRFDPNGGGGLLAVVLERLQGQTTTYLVLESPNRQIPAFSVLPIGTEHLSFSYGTGWYLELRPDEETFPGNAEGADSVGEIRIHDAGVTSIITNVLDQKMRGKLTLVNLVSYGPVPEERYHGARVRSWRIWTDEPERQRLGGKPIFAFPSAVKDGTHGR